MKSPSFRVRLIGPPLFCLALSLALVSHQYARRNRLAHELKVAQTEYVRLSRGASAVPAGASAMIAESYQHTHSEAEEEARKAPSTAPSSHPH